MASLDEAFSGRRMLYFNEPVDEIMSKNVLQEALLNRQVQRALVTPSQQLELMRNC